MITRPLEAWPTIHRDAYPAYITWDAFMANQAQLSDNANRFDHRTRGAARQGHAVLVGLVVCGRCGRQMRVGYKPHTRYFCSALSQAYGESQCLNLDGPSIEQAVVQAFFEAIQPAELDLLDAVLRERRADRERVAQQHADRVARAAYEVALARCSTTIRIADQLPRGRMSLWREVLPHGNCYSPWLHVACAGLRVLCTARSRR
jgi:hypothetical protein